MENQGSLVSRLSLFRRYPQIKAWSVVLGGVLVHLSLGTIYTVGNMTPYIASYIRNCSSPEINYSDATWIFAISGSGQGLSMFLGGLIDQNIGPRLTVLLGGWFSSLGVMLTYFTIQWSYYALLATYCLMFGLGVGVAYAVPMACAMRWLPTHKGLVNGMVVAGFGGGAFIFNQVQTAFINPENKSPDITVGKDKYFSQSDVLERVPYCFLLIGGCYAVLQFLGILFICYPPEDEECAPLLSDSNGEKDATDAVVNSSQEDINSSSPVEVSTVSEVPSLNPIEAVKSVAFWMLWIMFFLNGLGVNFISTLYKAFGQIFIVDDKFLALAGSFASVLNALGRIMWGHLADRISFRVTMMILCTSMSALMLTLSATPFGAKPMFFIWICLIFGTFSGNFSLFPTATARSFGQKNVAIIYGLVFTSNAVNGPIAAFLTQLLQGRIGYFGMFCLVAGFSAISGLIAFLFNVKKPNGDDI